MSWCLLRLTLFLVVSIVQAQNATVVIHIKLIDGRTGQPIKDEQVGLEDRADYHEISVRTNCFAPDGVDSTLGVSRPIESRCDLCFKLKITSCLNWCAIV